MRRTKTLIILFGLAALSSCSDSTTAPRSADELRFARISAGEKFSCGLTDDGTAYCWGNNERGQLGDGTTSDRAKPTRVATTLQFSTIASGFDHSCAITLTGEAYCWGGNRYGKTGALPMDANQLVPVAVPGGLKFMSIAPSNTSTCGTTAEQDLYCWGHIAYTDFWGTALSGVKTVEPTRIATGMVAVVAGLAGPDGATYCSVDQNQLAYCWFLLYTYPPSGPLLEPVRSPVSATLKFETLRAGPGHVCGVTTSAETYCWGWNNLGQLGDGTTEYTPTPTRVSSNLKFESLAVGGGNVIIDDGAGTSANSGFSCGLASGKAYCWGANNRGQLGIGTTGNFVSIPQPVAGGHTFVALRAGGFHACGLVADGSAYCWGNNDAGQIGDGSFKSSAAPKEVVAN